MTNEIEGTSLFLPYEYRCKICDKPVAIDRNYNAGLLYDAVAQSLCPSCTWWSNTITHPPQNFEVIGGIYYIINPPMKRPLNKLGGMGGKECYIRKFNGQLYKSNNVWNRGEVPEHFRPQLPDTANFMPLMPWQRLFNDNHTCTAKGCYNRYHCVRYDMSVEANGPYNTIPDDYVIQSDKCDSFIHIHDLL